MPRGRRPGGRRVRKALDKSDREVPAELDVHVILDDLSTHKTPTVKQWLLRHQRFHFHSIDREA